MGRGSCAHGSGLLPRVLAFWFWALLALGGASAFGAAYTWDPAMSTTSFGGNGTWDYVTPNWWDGTTTAVWSNNPIIDAWFTGTTGGTVTLAAQQDVNNLVFSTSGYVLSSNVASSTLNVDGGNITTYQCHDQRLHQRHWLHVFRPGQVVIGEFERGADGPSDR